LEICDRPKLENVAMDHLSRLDHPNATFIEQLPIDDSFMGDQHLANSNQVQGV